jgi:glycosyltransferase involved in cell wall biosynthesis
MRVVARAGSVAAVVLTAHTAINLRLLRRPPAGGRDEPLSVLVPVRNEASRILPCLQALSRALDGYGPAEAIVVDDGSTDGTDALVRAHGDPRVRLLTGNALPAGWLGKPHACHQAAAAASPASTVLVFLDADVELAPDALRRTVGLLRGARLDLVSPYPRQRAETVTERVVQPLLQWSWATFLPLRAAEASSRPSLTAANGQLMAVDAASYRASGGHEAVRHEVLDDLALLKAFKRSGFRGGVADGTDLATCRMYENWSEVRDGYTKSLWSAFGSPAGAAAAIAALIWVYVLPPLAFVRRPDRVLAAGTLAGVAGRAMVARRVAGRVWPDSATQPISILTLGWLTARSWRGRRGGNLHWKGRLI